MEAVAVLTDPAVAVVALEPLRARVLARLAEEPGSAATVAAALGEPRQRIRYHLGQLADHGLVSEVEQRHHGGITERVFTAVASSYVIASAALGAAGATPRRVHDRLSSAYLVALASRAVGEVGALARGAVEAGKPLPTLSIDTAVRFGTPADRAAFAADLDAAVVDLVARYHDDDAPDGRWYRLVALAHPRPQEDTA